MEMGQGIAGGLSLSFRDQQEGVGLGEPLLVETEAPRPGIVLGADGTGQRDDEPAAAARAVRDGLASRFVWSPLGLGDGLAQLTCVQWSRICVPLQ